MWRLSGVCLEGFWKLSGRYLRGVWNVWSLSRVYRRPAFNFNQRTGQVRTDKVRVGQVRKGQVGKGQVKTGQVRTGQVGTGPVRTGQLRNVKSVQVKSSLTVQVKTGQVQIFLGPKTVLDPTFFLFWPKISTYPKIFWTLKLFGSNFLRLKIFFDPTIF